MSSQLWRRYLVRSAPVLVLSLGACRVDHAKQPARDLTITPAGRPAPPLVVDGGVREDAEVEPRFELSMGGTGFCAKIHGRVHCATPQMPKPWLRLTDSPALEGITDAVNVSAVSPIFGCASTRAGAVHCWGNNTHGQLGAGIRAWFHDGPVVVPGVAPARRVATSEHHACAILADETVRCWGDNRSGATGGDVAYAEEARELVAPVEVKSLRGVKALALSESASCAITRTGTTLCWGRPMHVPRDDAAHVNSEIPSPVPGAAGLDQLIGWAGGFCGIRATSGEVICWGYGMVSDLHGKVHPPKVVTLPRRASRVAIGSSHACALLVDGRIACWGSNWSRAMGDADIQITTASTDAPLIVPNLPPAIDLFAGRRGDLRPRAPEPPLLLGDVADSVGRGLRARARGDRDRVTPDDEIILLGRSRTQIATSSSPRARGIRRKAGSRRGARTS